MQKLFPVICVFLCLIAGHSFAGSATWSANPVSGDWNTAANWTPATVPNGPGDIATFATSNLTAISLSADTEVNEIVFAPGAAAFTINASAQAELTFSGTGITNNSGVTQNFVTTPVQGTVSLGVITFSGTSSAGSGTVFTNHPGQSPVFQVGTTNFRDQSSAGSATFINFGGNGGNKFGGETNFFGGDGGRSTIIVNGAEVAGSSGGRVFVGDGSSLQNATLVADGGPGLEGGTVAFDSGSSGGTVALELFGSGSMESSLLGFHSKLTVGSIEGDGTISLGDSTLGVGSNNRSTTFDGLIEVGEFTDGFGGNLEKSGLGTLTLTQANSYTEPLGSTVVTSGFLRVRNNTGSATGNGPVQVNGGILGGDGIIAGATTIGTGAGAGAVLQPGQGASTPTVLTIQKSLTFSADATYVWKLNTKKAKADQVIANGVSIQADAQFDLYTVGNKKLTFGKVFTAINNTATTAISGTFANLADGSTVTAGMNKLQVSYSGNDGNDLTLTVVP